MSHEPCCPAGRSTGSRLFPRLCRPWQRPGERRRRCHIVGKCAGRRTNPRVRPDLYSRSLMIALTQTSSHLSVASATAAEVGRDLLSGRDVEARIVPEIFGGKRRSVPVVGFLHSGASTGQAFEISKEQQYPKPDPHALAPTPQFSNSPGHKLLQGVHGRRKHLSGPGPPRDWTSSFGYCRNCLCRRVKSTPHSRCPAGIGVEVRG